MAVLGTAHANAQRWLDVQRFAISFQLGHGYTFRKNVFGTGCRAVGSGPLATWFPVPPVIVRCSSGRQSARARSGGRGREGAWRERRREPLAVALGRHGVWGRLDGDAGGIAVPTGGTERWGRDASGGMVRMHVPGLAA